MNNEPVAWINLERWKDAFSYLEDCVADMKLESAGIVTPLYTHPAKTLTDKEINWLAKAYSTMEGELNAPAFARAILRKAQGD
jgi:hypothetical protein